MRGKRITIFSIRKGGRLLTHTMLVYTTMIGRAKQYSIVTKKEGYRVFKKSGIQFVKYFISTFSETNLQHNRPTKADRMIIHMYQLNNTTLNFTSPFYTNNQIWAAYMHHINININYN